MKKKAIKISIPEEFYNTIQENVQDDGISISEYINYLIYKENYLHFSINEMHVDDRFKSFYEKYISENEEKDVWSTLFNL